MTAPRNPDPLFRRRHFEQELIILCVRWYISYKLSYRDLTEMMAERGVAVAHTTLLRWTQRYVPEFEKRWKQFSRPVGCSWRMDETYTKVRGEWAYLYRAVDKHGRTVDFRLSKHRDIEAAKQFFRQALGNNRPPRIVILDAYRATHRALRLLRREHPAWRRARVRTCKYLNNIVEQDHRGIKSRTGPMLGFQLFTNAATAIAGIELIRRIKKGQFKLGQFAAHRKTIPQIWAAVLDA